MSTVMYKALKSAGVGEKLATAAAKKVPEEPATQGDVTALKVDIATLKVDIAALEARLTWRMITIGGVYSSLVVGLVKFL